VTDTFIWKPIGTPSGPVNLRVKSVVFGDGYSQEAGDGLNNKSHPGWQLQFAGTEAEMQTIADFFDAHAGWQSFYWTPPLGVQGRYKVKTYTPQQQGPDIYTITATFEEKFTP
jgi:phage-related protein